MSTIKIRGLFMLTAFALAVAMAQNSGSEGGSRLGGIFGQALGGIGATFQHGHMKEDYHHGHEGGYGEHYHHGGHESGYGEHYGHHEGGDHYGHHEGGDHYESGEYHHEGEEYHHGGGHRESESYNVGIGGGHGGGFGFL